MIVRDAKGEDRAAVDRLTREAFGQAAEANLVQALTDAGDAIVSLVAVEEALILGHLVLSRLRAPFRALALAPLSVSPPRQGRGVGSQLLAAAVDRARQGGWEAVFVLGDPGYYARFGFDANAAAGFSSPYAGPHFMVLALVSPLPARRGEVRHAPAFGALDDAAG